MKKESARNWNKRDALAVAVLVVLWGLFFWRYLTPNELDRVAFPAGDFTYHFYPYRTFAFAELRAGRLPVWMPCTFSGYPFLAEPQAAVFYPPALFNYLVLLAAGITRFPLRALELEAMAHVLLASLLTYAFLRTEVRRRTAALLGAVVFAYGGYLTSYPPLQLAILESATWLPLTLLGTKRGMESGHWGWGLVAIAGLALSILAGHPQTAVIGFYATLAYALYLAWRMRLPWRTVLARILIVCALAAGLCAAQLLPTIEYTRLSTRAGIPFDESGTGFPAQDVVQFVVTGLVSHWQPLYVGILPLVLVWLALIVQRRRDTLFWLGVAAVALVLALGKHVFGFEIAYLLWPAYNLFRGQERHAFLVGFALSVLAAYGTDTLLAAITRRQRIWALAATRFLRNALPVLFLLTIGAEWLRRTGRDVSDSGTLAGKLGILVLVTMFTVLLLYARFYLLRARRAIGLLAVTLVVFDLFSLNRPLNYAEPRDPYPVTPVLQPILAERDAGGLFRVQDDYRLAGHTCCMHGLNEVWGIAPIKLEHYRQFMDRAPEAVRWKLLGVRYLVTWRGSLVSREGTAVDGELVYQKGEGEDMTCVYRLAGEMPRAFIVRNVRQATSPDDVYRILGEPGFDPLRTVVVQTSLNFDPAPEATDKVTVTKYTPTEITLDVSADAPGLLVLSEVTYPGWRAEINGQAVSIVEADGILRAIPVEAGHFTVHFRYQPTSLCLGLAVSIATLLVCCAGAAIFWRRGRRRGEP
ncbi:MAG: YfhO family protein [Anaerolineae bacterium]|nr:YfhO family protein [Anaerolineae bacterium]MDH7474142.1 YfhO family protein [Anaerolineae bacterium]